MAKKKPDRPPAVKDGDPRPAGGPQAAGDPGLAPEDGGFLQRWSERKAATAAHGGPDAGPDAATAGDAPAAPEAGGADEAALSDEELCEKYELRHPEQCDDPAELGEFFNRPLPDRLRQMAMRRMWRINPLFRFADEMVEYGENYTDAATVLPDMKTAYQVGKGYFDKLVADGAPGEDGESAETAADAGKADEDAGAPEAAEAEAGDGEQEPDEAAAADGPDGTGAGVGAGGGESAEERASTGVRDTAPDGPAGEPRPIRPRQVSFRRP